MRRKAREEILICTSIDREGHEGVVGFDLGSGPVHVFDNNLSQDKFAQLERQIRLRAMIENKVMLLKRFVSGGVVSVTCPKCGRTSENPNDCKELYCGHCHVFLNDEIERAEHLKEDV